MEYLEILAFLVVVFIALPIWGYLMSYCLFSGVYNAKIKSICTNFGCIPTSNKKEENHGEK